MRNFAQKIPQINPEKIWFFPYTLQAYHSLNAKTVQTKARQGVLLRFDFPLGSGFADCHPWKEFGDESLFQQLKLLKESKLTPLTQNSFLYAWEDAQAREKEKLLFKKNESISSHYTMTDISPLIDQPKDFLSKLENLGYDRIKVKIKNTDQLKTLKAVLQILNVYFSQIKLRLDLNASAKFSELMIFLKSLDKKILNSIEFLEDPVPFFNTHWKLIAEILPIAQDFEKEAKSNYSSFKVFKPAVESIKALNHFSRQSKIVVTSYMDHPVGQVHALAQAIKLKKKYQCNIVTGGFLSHLAYEPNEFSEQLKIINTKLQIEHGTGIGFDDSLEKIQWRKI